MGEMDVIEKLSVSRTLSIGLCEIDDYFKNTGCQGLCSMFYWLYCDGVIDSGAYREVLDYLLSNKPSVFSKRYWWHPGAVGPRKDWLKRHIDRLTFK